MLIKLSFLCCKQFYKSFNYIGNSKINEVILYYNVTSQVVTSLHIILYFIFNKFKDSIIFI